MKRFLPSPAMIVALLSLAVALGGTAYAVKLKRNSVGAKQIKTDGVGNPEIAADAVGAPEIGADAVGASEIGAATVGASELGANSVNSASIADGSLGRQDAARGVLANAYARINQRNLAEPAIAPGAVNVIDLDDAGNGQVIVSFDPQALPGGSVATCAVMTTFISHLAGLADPASGTVVVDPVDPGSLSASSVEVQTHLNTASGLGTSEEDFFIQVSCPPG